MRILVQKFGGTSVGSKKNREFVYKKIIETNRQGYAQVIVISAMGRNGDPYATDTLLELIKTDCPNANMRELDQIFVCGEVISGTIIASNLTRQGIQASFLTGQQAGIITDGKFGNGEIIDMKTSKILSSLEEGIVVVVAGGQGVDEHGEITSLGRGGSDITATALGVALNAKRVEIYTDVVGIMTTDPRIVNNARVLDEVSYEECIIMAEQGAKIIHPRAVKYASKKAIPLLIRSTIENHKGTLISKNNEQDNNKLRLTGVTKLDKQVLIELNKEKWHEINDEHHNISLSSKVYNKNDMNIIENQILIDEINLRTVLDEIDKLNIEYDITTDLSTISIVGNRLKDIPNFYNEILGMLKEVKIEPGCAILNDNYMSFVVAEKVAKNGVKVLHEFVIRSYKTLNN